MNLLVKLATRERPQPAIRSLLSFHQNAKNPHRITYLISLDEDDTTTKEFSRILHEYPSLRQQCYVMRGTSIGKHDAINRDILEYPGDWDILLVSSDDFTCIHHDWDEVVVNDMQKHFPLLDGALNYDDGLLSTVDNCTFPIFGYYLYLAFGYVYHPALKSLFGDTEFTRSCLKMNRIRHIPNQVLFRHDHYSAVSVRRDYTNSVPKDPLYLRNDALFDTDAACFAARQKENFDIARVSANLTTLLAPFVGDCDHT